MTTDLPGQLASQWRKSNKPLGLMLDYDGTLTPIVDDPAAATLTLEHTRFLTLLATHPNVFLAVVSGRSLSQLQQFLPQLFTLPVIFAGLHGGQISVANQNGERVLAVDVTQPALIAALQLFKQKLSVLLSPFKDYTLEDKTLSLAFHYKNMAPDPKENAKREFMALFESCRVALLNNNFKVQTGKDVLELLPNTCNKGQAASWILDYWQSQLQTGVFPCFMGDDVTDESAFTVVNLADGLSFCVGKTLEQTQANYILPSVNDVYTELAILFNT